MNCAFFAQSDFPTPEGLLLTSLTPAEAEQLRLGREVMRRCRNTLRELAK